MRKSIDTCAVAKVTFERSICSNGVLQLLVHLPVEGPPDGGDVGSGAALQMDLLAELLNHEGLAQGSRICCMLLDPHLQEIQIPSLHIK